MSADQPHSVQRGVYPPTPLPYRSICPGCAKCRTKCPTCGGSGYVEREVTRYVTREMAIDGGDRQLEGQPITDTERIDCPDCADPQPASSAEPPITQPIIERMLKRMPSVPYSLHDQVAAALRPYVEAAERLAERLEQTKHMLGHHHWDSTGQHGAGCPLCQQQRVIVKDNESALAAYRSATDAK